MKANPAQFFTSVEDIQNVISILYGQSMTRTNLLIDKNVLTRVCNRILSSSFIDIYGIGISDTIAKQMVFKLQALDLPCSFQNGINLLHIQNIRHPSNHVAILISLGDKNVTILEIAKKLKEQHIYTVALTGVKEQELLANISDYLLFDRTSFPDIDSMCSTFSVEYLINLIYATLIYRLQTDKYLSLKN